jgi:hypothetical protein
VSSQPSIETLYLEYARAMAQAQLFEKALQAVAVQEIDVPEGDRTSEEMQARTERFFSRPVNWIQQRLDIDANLAAEIDALRHARNELAHGYLVHIPFSWPDEEERSSGDDIKSRLPEHVRAEMELMGEMAAREAEAERQQAIEELRKLRARFHDCNGILLKRFMSVVPHYETWEEVEQSLRERRSAGRSDS